MAYRKRTLAAVLAATTLTAFAPAPLPRPDRGRSGGKEGVAPADLQGVWQAVGIEEKQNNGQLHKVGWGYTRIVIRDDHWAFLSQGKQGHELWMTLLGGGRVDLRLSNRPQDPVALAGILRRRGGTLLLLYTFEGPSNRPTDFERIPPGCRVMTLQKEP